MQKKSFILRNLESITSKSWIVCIGFSTPQGMHPPPAGEGEGVKISERSLLGGARNFEVKIKLFLINFFTK